MMSETVYVEKLLQVDGTWCWQPTAIELDTEGDFTIDDLNLDRELCRMGIVLLKYADLAAELGAEVKRKDESVKYLAASLSAAIRSQAEKDGVKKSVNEIEGDVTRDDSYQALLRTLHVLRASAVRADHWWRSANTKAEMLKALAFRQSAEIRRGAV
jgi:hypothetical protein